MGEQETLGAPLDRDGLCPDCAGLVRDAVVHLPLDTAELSTLMQPSTAIRLRDPDAPAAPRIKLHSPVPIRTDVEALRALILHETTMAAADLAVHVRVPWSPRAARQSRIGDAVKRSCLLIGRWLPWFLDMPAMTYPARSLTARRADGHDPDTTTRDRADYWTTRDGADRAMVLLDLHERVYQLAGRIRSDRLPEPCPVCQRALYREHARGIVKCSAGHQMDDDDYDEFTQVVQLLARDGQVAR
jgi:hypothetical protein